MKNELKLGETLKVGFITVEAVPRIKEVSDCSKCAFYDVFCFTSLKITGSCKADNRSDKTDIIFIEK